MLEHTSNVMVTGHGPSDAAGMLDSAKMHSYALPNKPQQQRQTL
jgi:hypothetical protein